MKLTRRSPWVTADGRVTCAALMTDLHLLNARRHVGMRELLYAKARDARGCLAMLAWGDVFENEIERRELDNVRIDYDFDDTGTRIAEPGSAAAREDYLGRLR